MIGYSCLIWVSMLTTTAHATDQALSGGIGPYHGGLGISYTHSPVVGLGLQVGAGLSGIAGGVRWQPTWMSGGYAQTGIARSGNGGYHPNMVVGGKWNLGSSDVFLDANGGVAVSLGGAWWPVWDVGVGVGF